MEFIWIDTKHPLYQSERKLRFELLYRPFGFFEMEELPTEDASLHLVALKDHKVIGCVLFHPEGKTGRMHQLAVSDDHQARGIGTQLVQVLEERLKDDGYQSLYKEVRLPVIEFFEKIGYRPEGDLYEKSGLDHRRMKKVLSP
jgi:N-acetylglutamate synthase-like GNAT family acetyltransferase